MAADKFTDVEFMQEYPGKSIAEHEIFMSFTNDQDAEDFTYWWADEGAEKFAAWLKQQRESEAAH